MISLYLYGKLFVSRGVPTAVSMGIHLLACRYSCEQDTSKGLAFHKIEEIHGEVDGGGELSMAGVPDTFMFVVEGLHVSMEILSVIVTKPNVLYLTVGRDWIGLSINVLIPQVLISLELSQ